ncbi:MAG: BMP family ABC transporter substrate-binding protein [Hyphomicrobiales bacterium]|nr:BMP family ABC transporter substrate-binding protein [Hyphomicrobiales bacterium]
MITWPIRSAPIESAGEALRIREEARIRTSTKAVNSRKSRRKGAFGALTLILALALVHPSTSSAEPLRPAILYNLVKFDASFNEGAYRGIERFKSETGTGYREFEVKTDVERVAVLRRFASRGDDPIIAIGFPFASAVEKVAGDFPKARFVIVDAVVDKPNVLSVVFKEQEGGFLVGVLAAMASKTGKVGMVGGMDLPIIRRLACGYEKGAKAASPGIVVLQAYAGDTPAAFADPARGAELARSEIGQGADVVLQAAGATGLGVLRAAADAKVLGIGSDSNQNGLFPGFVLTSLLKRTDNAVYLSLKDAASGNWRAGTRLLGVAEGGIDVAIDDANKALVTDKMRSALGKTKDAITSGELVVPDWLKTRSCPP